MQSKIIDLFFPKICPVCNEVIPFGKKYCGCSGCEIKRIGSDFCENCGNESDNCTCDEENSMKLRHIASVFVYTGEIRERILSLKFSNEKSETRFFGIEMALRFSEVYPNVRADVVTFVPMTKNERKERGFNQSELIAKAVAKALFINCEALLQKTTETERQHTLSSEKRLTNLNNTFEPQYISMIKGKTILLCDDIKTTGTTLKRCADVLFESGAKDVYCLTAAISDYVSKNNKIF